MTDTITQLHQEILELPEITYPLSVRDRSLNVEYMRRVLAEVLRLTGHDVYQRVPQLRLDNTAQFIEQADTMTRYFEFLAERDARIESVDARDDARQIAYKIGQGRDLFEPATHVLAADGHETSAQEHHQQGRNAYRLLAGAILGHLIASHSHRHAVRVLTHAQVNTLAAMTRDFTGKPFWVEREQRLMDAHR